MRKFLATILCLGLFVGGLVFWPQSNPLQATIATEKTRNVYSGNGTVFQYEFKIYAKTDLLVIVRDASGNEETQTVDSDYTVSGIGLAAGGNVTFTVAPASTETILILRNRPFKQETSYSDTGPFLAKSHEDALDELTMLVQQLQEQLDRTPHLKKSETATDIEISDVTAGEYLRWNLAGTGIDSIPAVYDLGNFLQSGTDAVSRTAASKMGEILSVTDFGAVGDGVADDTAAIQAAINAGGRVNVPETSTYYKVTGNLTLRNSSHIRGFGKNSQIRQTTVGTDLFVASSKSGIIIENLYLYGTTGAARGIEFTTVTDSKIKDCVLEAWGDAADGSGIWLNTNSHDNEIIGNEIDSSYYGIFIGGGSARNIVEGNEVDSAVTAGIWLKTGIYNTVRGNIVHGCGLPGLYVSVGANYNSITGNVVYSNDDSGIYIWDEDTTDSIGNVVDGNTFYDNSPAEIFLRTVTNNVISNNTCMSSRGFGIYLTDAASRNVVSGNSVKSSTSDGIKLYYAGAELSRENIIFGNVVISSGGYGIALHAAHESQVKENIISSSTDYGILLTGGTLDSVVSGNTLKANDGGIYFNNADYDSIINNLIVSLSGGSSEYGVQITANSDAPIVEGNRFRISSNLINNLNTATIVRNNMGLDDETATAAAPALQHWGSTEIDSTSNAVDATLASGAYIGQIKTIVMTNATNTSTVTVAHHNLSDGEVFDFAAVDAVLVLMWIGTEWITLKEEDVGRTWA